MQVRDATVHDMAAVCDLYNASVGTTTVFGRWLDLVLVQRIIGT